MAGPGVVIGKVSVKVTPDTSRFRQSLRAQLNKIEKSLRPITVHVKVDLDDDDLRRLRHKLDDIIDDYDGEPIDYAPGLEEAAYRHAQARLAILSRPRRVELFPTVNKAAAAKATATLTALSGLRVLNRYLQRTLDLLGNLDRNIPMLTIMGNAIGALGAWGLTAASNLFALSASLAQISGAALALPGIFAGLAIGIGATVAVFRDWSKVMADINERFGDLRNDMSDRFWAKAEKPIRNMIDKLFPELRKGLLDTSDALARYFSRLSNAIGNALEGRLEGMFDNLNESIDVASKGTKALAGIIETLGTTGSAYLPRLAAWFVRISKQFNNFLSAAAKDGRLQGWIDAGIAALSDLGRVLRETGRILGGLFTAAAEAGGSSLGMLADTLEKVADVVNGEPFRSNLVMVFEAAHEAMSLLADRAGPSVLRFFSVLAGVLDRVLPIIGETVGALLGGVADSLSQMEVSSGFEAMFRGMQEGIEALLPVLPDLGRALGSVMDIVGVLAKNLGPVLAPAIEAVSVAIETLTPVVETLADIFSSGLATLLETLGPDILGPLTATILVLVGAYKVWTAAQMALNLAMTLNPIGLIIAAIAALVVAFIYLWNTSEGFRQFWISLWDGIKNVVDVVVDFVQEHFGTMIDGIKQIFGGGFDVLLGLWDIFAGIFTGDWDRVWEGVKKVASGLWEMLKGLFKAGWGFLQGMFTSKGELIRAIWNGALELLKSAASAAWEAIKDMFWDALESVKKWVSDKLDAVIDNFYDLKDDILGFFSGVGDWLVQSGKDLINGFVDGIKSAASNAGPTMAGVMAGLRGYFPFSPAKKGPFSGRGWVYYSGLSIGEGLAAGMRASRHTAESAADMLADSAMPSLPQFQPDSTLYDETASVGGITIYQTNHNPQQQPAEEQINEALQVAAALGF